MIQYYEDRQTFHLTTQSTSYVMALADGVWLGHLYYGAKLHDTAGMEQAFRLNEFPFSPAVNERDKVRFMQMFPFEYSFLGTGDYRDVTDFGTYWYDDPVGRTNGEFDCVLRRSGDRYDFYECKYYDRRMTLEECRREETQVRGRPGLSVSKVGFVCTGGFDVEDTGIYALLTGDMLYQI